MPAPIEAQPVQTVTATTEKRFHISKLQFVIPGLILLISIIAITIFVNGKKSSQAIVGPTPLPTLTTPTPTPSPEPVVQTLTYTNTEKDFSFQYPETYQTIECDKSIHLVNNQSDTINIIEFCASPVSIITIDFDSAPLNSNYLNSEDFTSQTRQWEVAENLATLFEITKTNQSLEGPEKMIEILANFPNANFRFTLNDISSQSLLDQITKSFQLIIDPTESWSIYENADYRLKHPTDWVVEEVSISTTKITAPDSQFKKSLTIKTSNETNAELSVTEIISSTRTLSGWIGSPKLTFRTVDTAPVQIIEGKFNRGYQAVVAMWRNTQLIQMNWIEDSSQDPQTLKHILSTFEFVR